MPYFEPDGTFGGPGLAAATKRLVFSSWTATPTAIASLLSNEAERLTAFGSTRLTRNTPEARKNLASRLNWAIVDGKANAMSTLALFWPHPELAVRADPLTIARLHAGAAVSAATAEADVAASLGSEEASSQAWQAYFRMPGSVPAGLTASDLTAVLAARGAESDDDLQASAGRLRREHRVRAQDPDFQAVYRQHRPMVERTLAWMTRGARRVPYRGTVKNNAWWVNRAAAINLKRLLSLGLTSQNGTWAIG